MEEEQQVIELTPTFYSVEGNLVYKNEEVNTGSQIAKIKTFYDNHYHISLEYFNGVVVANVLDYENFKHDTFNGDILFSIDGVEQLVTAVNGSASIEVTNNTTDPIQVLVTSDGLRGGEIFV